MHTAANHGLRAVLKDSQWARKRLWGFAMIKRKIGNATRMTEEGPKGPQRGRKRAKRAANGAQSEVEVIWC